MHKHRESAERIAAELSEYFQVHIQAICAIGLEKPIIAWTGDPSEVDARARAREIARKQRMTVYPDGDLMWSRQPEEN